MPGGPPAGSTSRQLRPTQVACSTPVMKPHRPVTRNPSGRGLDGPARADRAGDDRAGLGEQLVEGGAGQVHHVDPRARPDHHRPARPSRRHGPAPRPRGAGRPASPRHLRGCGAGASRSSLPSPGPRTRSGGTRRAASVSAARADTSGARSSIAARIASAESGTRFVMVSLRFSSGPLAVVTGGWAEAGDAGCGAVAGAGWVPPRHAASGAPRPSPRCSTRSSRRSVRRGRCTRGSGGR